MMKHRGTAVIAFSIVAAIAWLILAMISVKAVAAMSVGAAQAIFLEQFRYPWPAQFGADFSIHLILVAAWMIWRSPSWIAGIICAILAVMLGAVFTLPYLVIATWRSGSVQAALVGQRR